MNLPPSTPSTSRANSGMSRLATMQAQFQAQQMAEKEKRLINMMAARQEETVRRIAYGGNGRMDSAPHSATSLSSNNSSNSLTAGVGQRPLPGSGMTEMGYQGGRVREYFEKHRTQPHENGGPVESGYYTGNGSSTQSSQKGPSPMGWDKSYPLKPVQTGINNEDPGLPPDTGRTPMYKRNISNASSGSGRNKYSGNYGLRSSQGAPKDPYKGRGYSLDRSRAGSRHTSPTRKLTAGTMTRTRSQVILGAANQHTTGNSSGDDSYGSSSRPPSSGYRDWLSGSTPMYSARNQRDLISVNNRNNLVSSGYVAGSVRNSARSVGNLSRSNSKNNLNYNPATWFTEPGETVDGYDDGTVRKTSYTREYVRNLPPTNQLSTSVRSSAPPVTSRASKLARSSSSHGNLNGASIAQTSAGEYGEHCSSYSSSHSSSDKSDPPAPYSVIPNHSRILKGSTRGRLDPRNGERLSRHNSSSDVRDSTPISSEEPYVYDEKSKINSQTFRKSRSPTSKGKNVVINNTSNHRSPSISPSRKHSISPSRRSYGGSSDDQVNNNSASAGNNNAYNLQQQKTNIAAAKNKEKEDEKRRLQAEMRRREQELLNKIKEQQKMLESMKHEKSKVERELHKHEVLREKERKSQDDQKREQDKEVERDKQRQARERIDAESTSARRNKYSREALRAAAAAESKKEICRTSSNSTSGSKGDVECEEGDDDYEKTNRLPSRTMKSSGGGFGASRIQRRKSPPKQLNVKPSSGTNQYSTTAYISNGDDNAVNISITSNGNAHDINKKTNTAQSNNQSKNIPNNKRNTAPNIGANSSANMRGPQGPFRKGPHHPSPSPSRKPIQQTRNSNNAQTSSSSPSKSSNHQTKASPMKERQSIFASKKRDDLIECSNCGRNFAEDRIGRHEDICLKTSKKKRKTFDMTKKRIQGTDAESFVLPKGKRGITGKGSNVGSIGVSASKQNPGKKNDWRKKRADFINALKAARQAQRHIAAGGKVSDLPPPPPSDTSDYVQCPYCNRRFNEGAADRHIPKCKDIKSNKR